MNEFNHTLPWLLGEFLFLDNHPFVYTVDSDGHKRVRFPGGGHCRLDQVIDRVTAFPSLQRRDRTYYEHDSSLIQPSDMRACVDSYSSPV